MKLTVSSCQPKYACPETLFRYPPDGIVNTWKFSWVTPQGTEYFTWTSFYERVTLQERVGLIVISAYTIECSSYRYTFETKPIESSCCPRTEFCGWKLITRPCSGCRIAWPFQAFVKKPCCDSSIHSSFQHTCTSLNMKYTDVYLFEI
jgi:hypothetical protein